jgi:hypothetical protein
VIAKRVPSSSDRFHKLEPQPAPLRFGLGSVARSKDELRGSGELCNFRWIDNTRFHTRKMPRLTRATQF